MFFFLFSVHIFSSLRADYVISSLKSDAVFPAARTDRLLENWKILWFMSQCNMMLRKYKATLTLPPFSLMKTMSDDPFSNKLYMNMESNHTAPTKSLFLAPFFKRDLNLKLCKSAKI